MHNQGVQGGRLEGGRGGKSSTFYSFSCVGSRMQLLRVGVAVLITWHTWPTVMLQVLFGGPGRVMWWSKRLWVSGSCLPSCEGHFEGRLFIRQIRVY